MLDADLCFLTPHISLFHENLQISKLFDDANDIELCLDALGPRVEKLAEFSA